MEQNILKIFNIDDSNLLQSNINKKIFKDNIVWYKKIYDFLTKKEFDINIKFTKLFVL